MNVFNCPDLNILAMVLDVVHNMLHVTNLQLLTLARTNKKEQLIKAHLLQPVATAMPFNSGNNASWSHLNL